MKKLGVSVKLRNDLDDYDYYHKLNFEDKKFLYTFHREYVNADFKHKNKILHNTKNLELSCYALNNARNRDLYLIAKHTGKLFLGDFVMEKSGLNNKYFKLRNEQLNPMLQDDFYDKGKLK